MGLLRARARVSKTFSAIRFDPRRGFQCPYNLYSFIFAPLARVTIARIDLLHIAPPRGRGRAECFYVGDNATGSDGALAADETSRNYYVGIVM